MEKEEILELIKDIRLDVDAEVESIDGPGSMAMAIESYTEYGQYVNADKLIEKLSKHNEENKKNVLVYIQGVKGRGEEVINTLLNLGAYNGNNVTGSKENYFYYIGIDGRIKEADSLQMNVEKYYTQIFLPYIPKDEALNREELFEQLNNKSNGK